MKPLLQIPGYCLCLTFLVSCLTSCSVLKKKKTAESPAPSGPGLLQALEVDSDVPDQAYDRLKAIADSPSANLPPATAPSDTPVESPTPLPEPVNPRKDWAHQGLQPAAIQPGDVFFQNMGPYLNKVASLIDPLPEGEREAALTALASIKPKRMPMTLSVAELAAIKAEVGPEFPLPERSVAFDIRMDEVSTKASRLEAAFEDALEGTGSSPGASEAEKKIRKQLQNTRERLQKGEELCVIVSVSRSKEVFGSYPGAPLGKRDSELIRNALEALYPHLDSLSSEKRETAIAITRDPMIYWEFDVRKLSLQGERIVIETQAFAAN